jgi:hypothetical protein
MSTNSEQEDSMFDRSGYWAMRDDDGKIVALVKASVDGSKDKRYSFRKGCFVPAERPITGIGSISDWDRITEDEAMAAIAKR